MIDLGLVLVLVAIALVLLFVQKGVFYSKVGFYFVKYYSKSYYIYERQLKKREKTALAKDDYKAMQQVALEKAWLESVAADCMYRATIYRDCYSSEKDVEAKRNHLLATIEQSEFVLPDADYEKRYYSKEGIYTFFSRLVADFKQAVIANGYNGLRFFPESILLYPKAYLVFALDGLISRGVEGSAAYSFDQNYLIKSAIEVPHALLPKGKEANKRFGKQFKNQKR